MEPTGCGSFEAAPDHGSLGRDAAGTPWRPRSTSAALHRASDGTLIVPSATIGW